MPPPLSLLRLYPKEIIIPPSLKIVSTELPGIQDSIPYLSRSPVVIKMPPPCHPAELPLRVTFVTLRFPLFEIPPPIPEFTAELPLILHYWSR